MISKGATTAALYAKDISSQATAKATELSGSVSEKIHHIALLLFKFYTLSNRAKFFMISRKLW